MGVATTSTTAIDLAQVVAAVVGFLGAVVGGAWLNWREVRRRLRIDLLRNIIPTLSLPFYRDQSQFEARSALNHLVRTAIPLSRKERQKIQQLVDIFEERFSVSQPPAAEPRNMTEDNRKLHARINQLIADFNETQTDLVLTLAGHLRFFGDLSETERKSLA